MRDSAQNPSIARWWQGLTSAWSEASEKNIGLLAAGIAYNVFLALVPLLTMVVLIYGIVAEPAQVARDIEALARTMPQEAASIIGDQLQAVVETSGAATGFGLVVALAIAIYGAMKGANGIVSGLNMVCGLTEQRPFLRRTRLGVAITVGLGLTLIAASLAISVLGFIESLLPDLGSVGDLAMQLVTWSLAGAAVSLVISLIYHRAPNRPHKGWRWFTPGSLLATVGWVVATLGFAFYVRNFGNYNATYGALSAVVVLLLWLSLSAYILLFGAQLDVSLKKLAGRPAA